MNYEIKKSTFVTVLAWIFIVGAGFTTFISILQNIMIYFIFPVEKTNEAFSNPNVQEHIPLLFRFLFSNLIIFFFCFLVISATTFTSAIGLLKRKNWARITFIVIMVLGILLNISVIIMQFSVFLSMTIHEETPHQFTTMMTITKIFTLMMAVAESILFGWIIKKLSSDEIKAEFIHIIENKNI